MDFACAPNLKRSSSYPSRFMDQKRGKKMWETVMQIVQELDTQNARRMRSETAYA